MSWRRRALFEAIVWLRLSSIPEARAGRFSDRVSLFDGAPFWLIPAFVAPRQFIVPQSLNRRNKQDKEIANASNGYEMLSHKLRILCRPSHLGSRSELSLLLDRVQTKGGHNAGRDFYGAVGSHTACLKRNTPDKCFSVRAFQQGW
jgi:hypothetical protein